MVSGRPCPRSRPTNGRDLLMADWRPEARAAATRLCSLPPPAPAGCWPPHPVLDSTCPPQHLRVSLPLSRGLLMVSSPSTPLMKTLAMSSKAPGLIWESLPSPDPHRPCGHPPCATYDHVHWSWGLGRGHCSAHEALCFCTDRVSTRPAQLLCGCRSWGGLWPMLRNTVLCVEGLASRSFHALLQERPCQAPAVLLALGHAQAECPWLSGSWDALP